MRRLALLALLIAPAAWARPAPPQAIRASAASLPAGLTLEGGVLKAGAGVTLKVVDGTHVTATGLFGKKKPKPKPVPEPDTVDFWCACFDGSSGSCSLSIQGQTATCGGAACCSMLTSPAATSVTVP
ncbi:MAG: hypothetical protein H6706_29815 [Myxococcales bacterium]|nr:hypothetical protein [Myxococcales bacterium]